MIDLCNPGNTLCRLPLLALLAMAALVFSMSASAHKVKVETGTVTGSTCVEAKKAAQHELTMRGLREYRHEVFSKWVSGCTVDQDANRRQKYSVDYQYKAQETIAHDRQYVKENYHNHNN